MSDLANRIVQKLWSYCNVLRDDGLSYQDYLEQLTFLLFLKMADERARLTETPQPIPEGYRWIDLANPQMEGIRLEEHYRETLRVLGEAGGMLGLIFKKAQNKIQDPAKLRQLVVELIGKEDWLAMSADVKGDAYEGLLEKNAQDVKGGAGQYFTPRPLIQAIVDCIQPRPGEVVCDPACGTGGFLLAAHEYLAGHYELDRDQKKHLRYDALRGVELVDGVSRLCAMNLFLHGIGPDDDDREPPIKTNDALRKEPDQHANVVITNPPFGKKSSITIVTDEGDADRETITYNRSDFWTTTSNKQLNFVQHVKSLLELHGRAAVVVPDNVLFEGGAGEIVRRKLLHECEVHTLLRLPTGIFYAQGVKANVVFFDRKPGSPTPWTKQVWVYDLRTNRHFTLKTRRLVRADLDEFVASYRPGDRHNRVATWTPETPEGRWRPYTVDEILARDKVSLDLFWLRDESLEDSASLPDPHVLAQEIADDLRAALEQVEDILGDLEARATRVREIEANGGGRQAVAVAAPARTESQRVVVTMQEAPPAEPVRVVVTMQEEPRAEPVRMVVTAQEAPRAEPQRVVVTMQEAPRTGPRRVVVAPLPLPTAQLGLGLGADPLAAILDRLRSNPDREFARADFLDSVEGLNLDSWLGVAKKLAEHPAVVKTGERRGTRYRWGGLEGQRI